MSIKHLNKNDFDLTVKDGVSLIDFYADWCGPCRAVAPNIEAVASLRPDITVGKINVDREPDLAHRFGIFSIPTIIVIEDGDEVARAVGYRTEEQLNALLSEQSLLSTPAATTFLTRLPVSGISLQTHSKQVLQPSNALAAASPLKA